MKTIPITSAGMAILISLLASPLTHASLLIFDVANISNGSILNQNYGDNITATTMGNFSYGSVQGFTPNVTVSYGPNSPQLWTNQFGNLTNVLISSLPDPQPLTLTFTADPGFNVRLTHSTSLDGHPGLAPIPRSNLYQS